MHHPRRRNVTTSMVGLKNGHIRKRLTPNGELQRYSWGKQKKKKKKNSLYSCPLLLLLLHSQLYLWGSPSFFFCIPSYISGVYHSSTSAFPAVSLGFTILLLLHSHLYLWGSPFFFFCVPSYISGAHHASSSVFQAMSLGFTIHLLLRSQLYIWGSQFVFFCVPSCISGVHCSPFAFPAISRGFASLLLRKWDSDPGFSAFEADVLTNRPTRRCHGGETAEKGMNETGKTWNEISWFAQDRDEWRFVDALYPSQGGESSS